MLIRKMAVTASLCAIAAGAFGATSASATTVEDSGGVLPSGTLVTNTTSDPAILNVTGLGSVTCTNTMAGFTIGTNPASVVSGTLDQLTFQSCTDTIPVITISSCHVVTPLPTVTVVGSGTTGGTVTLHDTFVRCNVSGGTSGCYYTAATAAGQATNATSTITYDGVSVVHAVPAGGSGDLGSLCGSTGSFGVTLTHIVAPARSNATVSVTG